MSKLSWHIRCSMQIFLFLLQNYENNLIPRLTRWSVDAQILRREKRKNAWIHQIISIISKVFSKAQQMILPIPILQEYIYLQNNSLYYNITCVPYCYDLDAFSNYNVFCNKALRKLLRPPFKAIRSSLNQQNKSFAL